MDRIFLLILSSIVITALFFNSVYAFNQGECGQTTTGDVTLTADITGCSAQYGITIGANNSVLDCAGYTISGDNSSGAYGISTNQIHNVTIKNCIIGSFDYGIDINAWPGPSTSGNNTIINNTLLYAIGDAVHVGGQSKDDQILNNTFYDSLSLGYNGVDKPENTIVRYNNFNGTGISSIWGINSTVEYNTIIGSTTGGAISLWASQGVSIKNNIISLNGSALVGVYLYNGANNTLVQDNNITGGGYGISITSGSIASNVSGNRIINSTYGTYISGSYNNIVQNNYVQGTTVGIYIFGGSTGNVVNSNDLASNGGVGGAAYSASFSPFNYNGTNYTSLYYLYGASGLVGPISADGTDISASGYNGTQNLSVAVLTIGGPVSVVFSDSIGTNCTTLMAWLSQFGAGTCDNFDYHAFVAGGAGNNYTWNGTMSVVSGRTSPPTLTPGASTNGGITVISSNNNNITSNTLTGNTPNGIFISNSANIVLSSGTITGSTIPFYMNNATSITLSNMPISSNYANYNMNTVSSKLRFSNAYALLEYPVSNQTISGDLATALVVSTRVISLNSSALSELNTSANVTIYAVRCDNFNLYHSSTFYTTANDVISNGQSVATQTNIGGNCTDSSICRNVQCTGTTLTFEAQHFDSFGVQGTPGTGEVSASIPSVASISMPTSAVSFGTMTLGSSNDTDDDSPSPFIIQNDGSVKVNVTISATDIWSSGSAANPSAYYQFKADNSSEGNCFNSPSSTISWANMPSSATNFLNILNFTTSCDSAQIDVKVTVPSDEPAGAKSSTVTLTASEA